MQQTNKQTSPEVSGQPQLEFRPFCAADGQELLSKLLIEVCITAALSPPFPLFPHPLPELPGGHSNIPSMT